MTSVNDFSRAFVQDPDEDRWRPLAACRDVDTDIFFSSRGGHMRRNIERARAVCAECPVIEQCRDYALKWDERILTGFWGGMTGRERRLERYRRGMVKGHTDERVQQTA